MKSNYAKHLKSSGHKFNEKFEILHIQRKSKLLDSLESLEMNRLKHKNGLLNDKQDLNNSSLLNLS